MVFWIVCAALTLGVSLLIAMPLLRPQAAATDNPDVAIYRAQLEEIDRDLERGLLEADEAERARAEVARRLIAANKEKGPQDGATGPAKGIALVGESIRFFPARIFRGADTSGIAAIPTIEFKVRTIMA